jgi:acetoin utilization protein AcuB
MMVVRDLINDSLLPLKPDDGIEVAFNLMDEYRVSHLPVVQDHEYVGIVSDTDLFSTDVDSDQIGNHSELISRVYVYEDKPVYDAIQAFADHKLTLLPVLDNNNKYLGVITMEGLVHRLAGITSVDAQGGIIILEIADKDYSLAQIAQIVEANDAKILSTYITSFPDSTRLEVTIKVNRMELGGILQAFNRYGFTVVSSFSDKDAYTDIIQERFDSLMNYLNI